MVRVAIEEDVLARGMWEPQARNECRRWWESAKHQILFVNALREVIGLGPIYHTDCAQCAQMGRLCSVHREGKVA